LALIFDVVSLFSNTQGSENMKRIALPATILGGVLVALLQAMPAQAQATRTWVSGVGDDANPCSRTAPCKTFAGAISKTAAGGEINCIDPGGFGTLTITKSMTVRCEGTFGSVLNSGGINGITINDSLSATPGQSKVILSGLEIDGAGTTPGLNGIRFISGASLAVHQVHIRNQVSGAGISVANASGNVDVHISDTYISNSGNSGVTGAIVIKPTGSGSVTASINNVQIDNNATGIRSDGNTTTGTIRLTVRNSNVAGNTNNGITVDSPTASVITMVHSTAISGNQNGLVAAGGGASILVGSSAISGNAVGVGVLSGGSAFTYGTNQLNGNASDGAFTAPPIALK